MDKDDDHEWKETEGVVKMKEDEEEEKDEVVEEKRRRITMVRWRSR